MMRVFLSLGSNLGDRQAHISEAIRLLKDKGLDVVGSSHLYETTPVEVDHEQENFLNMAIQGVFDGDATELLDLCQEVERCLGRTRPYHHAPRTIDIDILLIDGIDVRDERLVVPHPGIENRAFVIHPLAEIAPDLILPSGKTVSEVKRSLRDDTIVMIPGG